MYFALYQHIAEQRMEQRLQEAKIEQTLALIEGARQNRWRQQSFSRSIYNRTRLLFRRHAHIPDATHTKTSVAESKHAIRTTFIHMHTRGLVSDYDEQFVDSFLQTFQQELLR